MISSVQGNNLFGTSASVFQNTSVSTTSVAEGTPAQEENEQVTATSADGDTLEISASSTNIVRKTYTGTSSQSAVSEDEGYTSGVSQAVASASASIGINEYTAEVDEASASSASTSSSSSSSTSSLSQYSEAELKEMLRNGEITQAEYNAEISSREDTGSEEDESTAGTAAAAETGATEG